MLEQRQVHPTEHPFAFRKATPGDVVSLSGLYESLQDRLDLYAVRPAHVWHYLLEGGKGTESECDFWLCEHDGVPVGYIRCPAHHFGDEIVIAEAVADRADVALAMLTHAASVAQEAGAPGLRLSLDDGSTLWSHARSLGARELGRYGWQVWCPDLVALLEALRPVLNNRLSTSAWAEYTGDVFVELYRYVLRVEIVDGVVSAVGREGTSVCAHLSAHEDQFVQLVLGYRVLGELTAWHPDVIVKSGAQPLLEVLFPKLNAFLYPVY